MCNFVGMKKAIVIIFAAMFCLLAASYYFDPGRRATLRALQEKGKQTTKDNMLSSQSVTSIACDRRELMWIGTSAGVNVYDGKNFVQFSHDIKDTTALPDDYINVLHLDKAGRMWVGTQNGLARYVGAYRFHRIALPDEHDNIVAIEDSQEKDDSMAVLVSDGIRPIISVGMRRLRHPIDRYSPIISRLRFLKTFLSCINP